MRCLWFWGDFGQPVSWSSGLCSCVAGEFTCYVLPWNLLALVWCLVSVYVCSLIFGKAVLILRTLFLVVVDFVLYQAHYLAAKGPNLKKETIYTFYKQTLVGCSLEVSEDTILVASVPRLPVGRNRLLFKMSKRKFLRASIQFCFSLLQWTI